MFIKLSPEVNQVGNALDEVDRALAVVVTQIASFEKSFRVENLWKNGIDFFTYIYFVLVRSNCTKNILKLKNLHF